MRELQLALREIAGPYFIEGTPVGLLYLGFGYLSCTRQEHVDHDESEYQRGGHRNYR